jgi:hypothetical protein
MRRRRVAFSIADAPMGVGQTFLSVALHPNDRQECLSYSDASVVPFFFRVAMMSGRILSKRGIISILI